MLKRDHYRTTSLSADGLVKTGKGWLGAVIVTASASGVIRLYDNTAASGTVIFDQFPVFPGDSIDIPMEFQTGLYFDLVSGTATVSILFI
jgi:hypothetical protein